MYPLSEKQHQIIFRVFQIAAVAVFFGRAYQHLFWDAPFRALFWEDGWMQWWVENFTSMSWKEYATSAEVNDHIQNMVVIQGYIYLLCGLIALFIKKLPKWVGKLLIVGSLCLFFLAFLYMKEKFYHLGQLLEYSLQFLSPIFLYLIVFHRPLNPKIWTFMKVAIALTFTCHGLYALGYYPRPGVFLTMTMNILGIDEANSIIFLKTAGILDFIISIGIFLPWRIAKWSLLYATGWGLATALARLWGHFHWQFWENSLHQYAFETVMRFPHFLIPLGVFLFYYFKNESSDLENN